jgi:hypothetical protein
MLALVINLIAAPTAAYAQDPTTPPAGMPGMTGITWTDPVPWLTTSSIGYGWIW